MPSKKDEIEEPAAATEDAEATDDAAAEAEAEPEEAAAPAVADGSPRVEAVGAGARVHVWECSDGDFVSRVSAAQVQQHIDDVHGAAPKSAKGRRR